MKLPTEVFGEVIVVHTPEELGADTSVQFAKFALTTQLYSPEERPPAGPLHEFAFVPAEHMRLACAVPVAAKTSYPVTPLVGDGDQLNVIGVLSF